MSGSLTEELLCKIALVQCVGKQHGFDPSAFVLSRADRGLSNVVCLLAEWKGIFSQTWEMSLKSQQGRKH